MKLVLFLALIQLSTPVKKLLQVIEEYQFDMGSITAVVHDQASNMEAGGRILESDWGNESLKSSAHFLQLCVNEGLQLVRIVKKIAAAKIWRLILSIALLQFMNYTNGRTP